MLVVSYIVVYCLSFFKYKYMHTKLTIVCAYTNPRNPCNGKKFKEAVQNLNKTKSKGMVGGKNQSKVATRGLSIATPTSAAKGLGKMENRRSKRKASHLKRKRCQEEEYSDSVRVSKRQRSRQVLGKHPKIHESCLLDDGVESKMPEFMKFIPSNIYEDDAEMMEYDQLLHIVKSINFEKIEESNLRVLGRKLFGSSGSDKLSSKNLRNKLKSLDYSRRTQSKLLQIVKLILASSTMFQYQDDYSEVNEKHLLVFETHNKGLGLKTLRKIKNEEFIIEYKGLVLNDGFYLVGNYDAIFSKDNEFVEVNYIINALFMGNYARFINHCCKPNCKLECLYLMANFILLLWRYAIFHRVRSSHLIINLPLGRKTKRWCANVV